MYCQQVFLELKTIVILKINGSKITDFLHVLEIKTVINLMLTLITCWQNKENVHKHLFTKYYNIYKSQDYSNYFIKKSFQMQTNKCLQLD